MSNIDTLQIYNELKQSGATEEVAQATAMAICHANRVTPEDLIRLNEKIRDDFAHAMEKLILKVDINFKWLSGIGATTLVGLLVNIILTWFKP